MVVLVGLVSCRSGGGSLSTLRTENGPTSTVALGTAPAPDRTAEGIPAGATGSPVAPGGTARPGGTAGATTGATGSTPQPATGAGTPAGGNAVAQAAPAAASGGGPAPANASAKAAPAASSASSGGTSPAVAAGTGTGDLAAFCPAERTLESRLAAVDPNAGPGPLRATVTSARAAFDPAVGSAPGDISTDLGVVVDAYGRLFTAFEDAAYDISRVSIGALGSFSPSTINAASGRVSAYAANRC